MSGTLGALTLQISREVVTEFLPILVADELPVEVGFFEMGGLGGNGLALGSIAIRAFSL